MNSFPLDMPHAIFWSAIVFVIGYWVPKFMRVLLP